MTSVGLIPRNRLRWIPPSERLAHEYCYFLHDRCVQMLVEYETAKAHVVTYQFKDDAEASRFQAVTDGESAIEEMLAIGLADETRRVLLNTITLAMVSDCMHHIFEALHCMERRKFIVALNLLRKPLLDSLVFLSWMLGDEDGFYEAFTKESPTALTGRSVGNRRPAIIEAALSRTAVDGLLTADWLNSVLFDPANKGGLYWVLQHAVHLVTVQKVELRTEPQNFNFIFKGHVDDDVYFGVYDTLPGVLLYLTHVIAELFQHMRPMDEGSKNALNVRSIYGFHLVEQTDFTAEIRHILSMLSDYIVCPKCRTPPKFTDHNAARMVMTESFRCSACGRITPFPFAWIF